eukprot:Plantae.Rhodophyta-Purpureofilum_apyrenoidigerum.ctg6882.p1 GENE.Plantae.Rhodophyta-Purpureofilum_apyrenoidigerum.ctg6882~~Plantae.Rhodophyta-Purpureofilum_apyrenoidigerum.ctg6882.p1  ORF type:complete len:470 (-),score=170.50 Plantae.Rhodophyta-Purpureofilum_apyrenoidigerum.ctg6882:1304-2713(-)
MDNGEDLSLFTDLGLDDEENGDDMSTDDEEDLSYIGGYFEASRSSTRLGDDDDDELNPDDEDDDEVADYDDVDDVDVDEAIVDDGDDDFVVDMDDAVDEDIDVRDVFDGLDGEEDTVDSGIKPRGRPPAEKKFNTFDLEDEDLDEDDVADDDDDVVVDDDEIIDLDEDDDDDLEEFEDKDDGAGESALQKKATVKSMKGSSPRKQTKVAFVDADGEEDFSDDDLLEDDDDEKLKSLEDYDEADTDEVDQLISDLESHSITSAKSLDLNDDEDITLTESSNDDFVWAYEIDESEDHVLLSHKTSSKNDPRLSFFGPSSKEAVDRGDLVEGSTDWLARRMFEESLRVVQNSQLDMVKWTKGKAGPPEGIEAIIATKFAPPKLGPVITKPTMMISLADEDEDEDEDANENENEDEDEGDVASTELSDDDDNQDFEDILYDDEESGFDDPDQPEDRQRMRKREGAAISRSESV